MSFANEASYRSGADSKSFYSTSRPIHTPQRRMRAISIDTNLSLREQEAEKFRILKTSYEVMRLTSPKRRKQGRLAPLDESKASDEARARSPGQQSASQPRYRSKPIVIPTEHSPVHRRPTKPPSDPVTAISAGIGGMRIHNRPVGQGSGRPASAVDPKYLRNAIYQKVPRFKNLCDRLSLFQALKDELAEHKKKWAAVVAEKSRLSGSEWLQKHGGVERQLRVEIQSLFHMMSETGKALERCDQGLWHLYRVFDKYVEMFDDVKRSEGGDSGRFRRNLVIYARQIMAGAAALSTSSAASSGMADDADSTGSSLTASSGNE